jgi:hypothetical protein
MRTPASGQVPQQTGFVRRFAPGARGHERPLRIPAAELQRMIAGRLNAIFAAELP